MSSPDFPDWQRPVASVESFALAKSGPASAGTQTLFQFGTSDAQSIVVTIDNDTGVGGQQQVMVTWYDQASGAVIEVDYASCWSRFDLAANPSPSYLHFPVRGPYVSVSILNNAGNSTNVACYTSTRPLPAGPVAHNRNSATGRLLLQTGNNSVAAGATNSFRFGPVPDAIRCRIGQSNAAVTFTLLAYTAYLGTPNTEQINQWVGSGSAQFIDPIRVPMTALEIQCHNTDTVAHNAPFDALDVS